MRELIELNFTLMEKIGDICAIDDTIERCAAALGAVTAAGHCNAHAIERLEDLGLLND